MNIGKYHTLELRYKQLNVQKIIVVVHATFAVARRKPEKNLGMYGIRVHDLCDPDAAL